MPSMNMKSCLAVALMAAGATAFTQPSVALKSSVVRSSSTMQMSVEDMPGVLPPVGFFDPLGFATDKSPAELAKFREAELKHGRVAMIAALGILVAESFNPLFGGQITGPAISHFQQADAIFGSFWVFVLFGVGIVEGQGILLGWENPEGTMTGAAGLKEGYVAGDLKFDPLGLKPEDEAEFNTLRTKELQNGRLAMLGVAGMIAQELVNGKGVLENLGL